MYSEDYIIRMIQQIVASIAHIAGLNRSGEHDKALAAVERTWGELLDVPRAMLDAVDTPSLAAMLREPARVRLAAQLFVEEARALAGQGEPQSVAARLRRALELYLEARAMDPAGEGSRPAGMGAGVRSPRAPATLAKPGEQDDAAIRELLRVVPVETLAPRYRAQV